VNKGVVKPYRLLGGRKGKHGRNPPRKCRGYRTELYPRRRNRQKSKDTTGGNGRKRYKCRLQGAEYRRITQGVNRIMKTPSPSCTRQSGGCARPPDISVKVQKDEAERHPWERSWDYPLLRSRPSQKMGASQCKKGKRAQLRPMPRGEPEG